ncbi:Out at first protein [Oopsacas minuta]|uniref:Out at first protein n=1 Tax=Oopsacas minuta TaxID=111878 RepID=A0AAV7KH59_9METZ|nr:Out at first protein [Oopsacas minuta]
MFDGKTLATMTDCSIEDIKETIRQLTSDGEELMSYNTEQWCGITHEPASGIDVFPAAPLHSYLRILDWFLNLIYRIAAGKSKWTEDQMGRDYRGLVYKRIHELTNLLFHQPGGSENTSTGNMTKTFLDALTEIHRNLSALLRVANSYEVVDVDRFRVLSQETYILILQTFPWVSISNTLHKFLAHAHQFIERNDRVGLCSLSEGGLEQGHKLIREFPTHLRRNQIF